MMEAIAAGLALIAWDVRYGSSIFIENGKNGVRIPVVLAELADSQYENIYVEKMADAVLKIDHILDELGCVQASTELRSYFEKREKVNSNLLSMEERIKEENRVHIQYKDIESLNAESEWKLNCFIVEILYRQNSSWQGCRTWSNHSKNPKKECFRSVLELLKLIQSSFETE